MDNKYYTVPEIICTQSECWKHSSKNSQHNRTQPGYNTLVFVQSIILMATYEVCHNKIVMVWNIDMVD